MDVPIDRPIAMPVTKARVAKPGYIPWVTCPDKLAGYQARIDQLKTDNTIEL